MNLVIEWAENTFLIWQWLIRVIAYLITQGSGKVPSHRSNYRLTCTTIPFTSCRSNIGHHIRLTFYNHSNLHYQKTNTFLPEPPAKVFFALKCYTYDYWTELLLELLVVTTNSESFLTLFFNYFHSLFLYL